MANETSDIRKIAINTGGGDAPGLNAVIRAVVLTAKNRGWEVYGIENGYGGLLDGEDGGVIPMTIDTVRGITHRGGTILGTSNRGNPFEWEEVLPDGTVRTRDRTREVVESFRALGFDALVAIGGDGSMHIAKRLCDEGLPIVGVPKTIDNDLSATNFTFGFMTAVETATDAIDKLHSTAESHQRVIVVEVMGRHTGWIAIYAGLAGTADVILIPEIPFDMDTVCEKIIERERLNRDFSIVCVAEGARPIGGEVTRKTVKVGQEEETRLGGLGERVAEAIAECTGKETRSLVLGHLQRGGTPIPYDRLLSLRFGSAAVRAVASRKFGCMVGLEDDDIRTVPIEDALEQRKSVPAEGELVKTARALGISFGDPERDRRL